MVLTQMSTASTNIEKAEAPLPQVLDSAQGRPFEAGIEGDRCGLHRGQRGRAKRQ